MIMTLSMFLGLTFPDAHKPFAVPLMADLALAFQR
jgi:hypothetical protein